MNRRGVKKTIASLELLLVFLSIFAFSQMMSHGQETFPEVNERKSLPSRISSLKNMIIGQLTKEIIPTVTASNPDNPGCCEVDYSGVKCSTNISSECSMGFHEGAFCTDVPACIEGCCYDTGRGIFDSPVFGADCNLPGWQWVAEPNCNIPEAQVGCCVLGEYGQYVTEGECDVLASTDGLENVVWDSDSSDLECAMIARSLDLGACITNDGECTVTTLESCGSSNNFILDHLCTSPEANTTCEPTTETMCVDGKDGVYFRDSCGNQGNIYYSSKVDDQEYWTYIKDPTESCDNELSGGSVESSSCGNCIRQFAYCSEDKNNDYTEMDHYCKSTSCDAVIDGQDVTVMNGESWCTYQGKVGGGDDVVGSEHILNECQFGDILPLECGIHRNEICIQNNTVDNSGNILVRDARCIGNNANECLNLNTLEDNEEALEECETLPHCKIQNITISEQLDFRICVPEHPTGFDLNADIDRVDSDITCGLASLSCYVQLDRQLVGERENRIDKCVAKTNTECMEQVFVDEMNEFCRRLGDCGGEVNYIGAYSRSYQVSGEHQGANVTRLVERETIKEGYHQINISNEENLINLSHNVIGQIVESADFQSYFELEWGGATGSDQVLGNNMGWLVGWGGKALKWAGGTVITSWLMGAEEIAILSQLQTMSVAGPLIMVAAGVLAGYILSEVLGLETGAARLMVYAGAWAGLGFSVVLLASNPLGWIAVAVAALIGLGALSLRECEDYVVEFECLPWEPPSGGDNCDLCNDEEFCSEYKCESLGAACELLNEGTDHELCAEVPVDVVPVITPGNDRQFWSDGAYAYDVTSTGFTLSASENSEACFEASSNILFSINTSVPAKCKFSTQPFEDFSVEEYFGLNHHGYTHFDNQYMVDPVDGVAQGLEYSEDMRLYFKCQNRHGLETPQHYVVEYCVNQGDDNSGPAIIEIIPEDDSLVGYDTNETQISVFTTELADCRWSTSPSANFADMENQMQKLSQSVATPPFISRATIPTNKTENTIYIDCMDKPWYGNDFTQRNAMTNKKPYTLEKPSIKIEISSIKIDGKLPDSTFETPTKVSTLELNIITSGGGNKHYCSWNTRGYEFVTPIFEDGSLRSHKVNMNLADGDQTIYVECSDETGDTTRNTTEFTIKYDGSAPLISRVWQEGSSLQIRTNEIAKCRYSTEKCSFDWETGTYIGIGGVENPMSTGVEKGQIYYIKCKDKHENKPSGSSCSMQIIAT